MLNNQFPLGLGHGIQIVVDIGMVNDVVVEEVKKSSENGGTGVISTSTSSTLQCLNKSVEKSVDESAATVGVSTVAMAPVNSAARGGRDMGSSKKETLILSDLAKYLAIEREKIKIMVYKQELWAAHRMSFLALPESVF